MKKWLEILNNEITQIYHHVDLFKKINEIIMKNKGMKRMDKTALSWMQRAFTSDLVIGIGKICDETRASKSFVKFLKTLKNKQEYLTRVKYISRFKKFHKDERITKHMIEIQNNYFDGLAGKGVAVYPKCRIDKDIKILTKENPCKKVIEYRNEYIAHFAKNRGKAPKYDDLFKAFGVIEKIAMKYNTLILGSSGDFTPTMQGDWSEIFTIPWIKIKKRV